MDQSDEPDQGNEQGELNEQINWMS